MSSTKLQFGIIDDILEGKRHPERPVMCIAKSAFHGKHKIFYLTDGGSNYKSSNGGNIFFLRCAIDNESKLDSKHLQEGSLIALEEYRIVIQQRPRLEDSETFLRISAICHEGFNEDRNYIECERHPLSGRKENTSSIPNAGTSSNVRIQENQEQMKDITNKNSSSNPYSNYISNVFPTPNARQNNIVKNNYNAVENHIDHSSNLPYNTFERSDNSENNHKIQNAERSVNGGPMNRTRSPPHRSMPYNQNMAKQGPVTRLDDNQFVPIRGLSEFAANWTIKARIVGKSDIRLYSNQRGEGKLCSIDILDESGDEIRCTFFNKAVDKFYDTLRRGEIYTFSKGMIKIADKRFNKHRCEISLGEDAKITHVDEDDGFIAVQNYSFVKIKTVEDLQKNAVIDILAIVTNASEVSTLTLRNGTQKDKRDMYLCDDSGCSIQLTIWGTQCSEFDEDVLSNNPVVAIKNARVDEYQGKKLSTSSTTVFDFNQNTTEANSLLQWYEKRGKYVEPVSLTSAGGRIKQDKRCTIAEIHEKAAVGTSGDEGVWLSCIAQISNIDHARTFYWIACPDCNRKVKDQNQDDMFSSMSNNQDMETKQSFCSSCNKVVAKPQSKYILNLEIRDSTGSMRCVAMGEIGKKLMQVDPETVEAARDIIDSTGRDFIDYFLWKRFREYVFRILSKAELYNDARRVKHSIKAVEPLSDNYASESKKMMGYLSRVLDLSN